MNFQPLKSIRVLDLTSVVVGPAATWRLGQYGAEIIKVESPDGDLMRGLGGQSPTGQHSGTYLHLNRGKRNICLDLKTAGAQLVMQRLIAQADVIVANMRPKALQKLGIDAATVHQKYPDKIYCLLTGFGTDGPYGGFPAYDSVVQAAAGIPGLSLARDGVPRYMPLLICDHVVGEIAAGAIMAALLERQSSGGRTIEIPMFETMAAFVLQEHLAQQSFVPPVGPAGDRRLLSPHNMPVQTSDGFVAVTINTDQQVRAFLQVTGRAACADDPRFATIAARADNVAAWFELRGAALTSHSTAEWLDIFRKADLAAMPCHTLQSLPADPHLQAVGLIAYEEHPTEGRIAVIRSSLRVDGADVPTRSPAAPCGWDTRSVLNDLCFSTAETETLILEGSAHEHHH
ncbi:CaiB/BaiF CoA transferase family protein [Cypionkella sp.]|uniref:CaiB/BaiF CoA transferase family protein n=1 Tax=Cypionkella sp. TaxID=2811411 RepID=UPI002FDDEEEB